MADITLGQPQALTGFLGPRVYEGLYGEPFPIGVQTSEGLTNAGVIDAALPLEQVRNTVASCLRIWQARPNPPVAQSGARLGRGASAAEPSVGNKFDAQQDLSSGQERGDEQGTRGGKGASVSETSAWDAVLATRADRRPGVTDLLDRAQVSVTLSGTGAGEVAGATQLALALIGETGCVVVGQDGSAQRDGARIGPADLRVARRGMALAAKWRLPFVSIIDTQGGELSADAESGALAGEIARCLADLSELPVPTISVLLGGGAGGAALALLPADRVIAAADAWVTPLPPEGAALIRHRDVGMAAQMADEQRITAQDLAAIGAVDVLLADPEGSAGVAAPYAALQAALANTTTPVAAADGTDAALLERRRQRWRRLAP
ncbi:MAG: hypothetical protein K0U64_04985 [Actinomycetia bacterium]|nr:hypothetical protein [Actinomycetes bacterium]